MRWTLYFVASMVLTSNALGTMESHKTSANQAGPTSKIAHPLFSMRKGEVQGNVSYAPPQPDSDVEAGNGEGDDGENGDETAQWTWSWARSGFDPSVTNNLYASGNGTWVGLVNPFTMTRIRLAIEDKIFSHSPQDDEHTTTVNPEYTPGCLYARVVKPTPPVGLAEATISVAGYIRLIVDGETVWLWDGTTNPIVAEASCPEGGAESSDTDDQ